MFKTLTSKVLGFVAGLALASGLAFATNTFYAGYNAQTNQRGEIGIGVAGGTPPVVTGTTGCGTLTGQTGGSARGSITIGTFATTCALTLTLSVPTIVVSGGSNSAAVPTKLICSFFDTTTQIVIASAIAATSTACSSVTNTGIVTGDVIQYSITAY